MILQEVKPSPVKADTDKPVRVCFVCTGNTCRSPMAAAVLNRLGLGAYQADSAGLYANEGEPISQNAVLALEQSGIAATPKNDYKSHTARQADCAFLSSFDKIVAISESHMLSLIMHFPELAERITVMPCDIPDPFMQSKEVYAACLEKITECIKELFAL